MGTTRWSTRAYHDRAARLRTAGRSAFAHDDDVRQGRASAVVHPLLDPAKVKGGARESRDSANHPASRAVAVLCDVTGSMSEVPGIVQHHLCELFNLLVDRKYLVDPAVLIGGIGDATCDAAPLQVGQFESGNEIDDDLSRLYLEGGGGGQKTESYELGLYFLARKTAIDCHEKRGQKGYAFLIGDELPYERVKRKEVAMLFGDKLEADIPIEQIVAEVQQKWNLYYILPNLTSYYNDPEILKRWRGLLGQNVLQLPDPEAISETIASTIGLAEGTADMTRVADDLAKAGSSTSLIGSVAQTLLHFTAAVGLNAAAKAVGGALTVATIGALGLDEK
jgi:hypothetical protein